MRKGTRKVELFPRPVLDAMTIMGFIYSKKGTLYKKYEDNVEDIIACAYCKGNGTKKIEWYIKMLERQLIEDEAIAQSAEFKEDMEMINDLLDKWNRGDLK